MQPAVEEFCTSRLSAWGVEEDGFRQMLDARLQDLVDAEATAPRRSALAAKSAGRSELRAVPALVRCARPRCRLPANATALAAAPQQVLKATDFQQVT